MKKTSSFLSILKGGDKDSNYSVSLPHVPVVSVEYPTTANIQSSAWGITSTNPKARQYGIRQKNIQIDEQPKEKDQSSTIANLLTSVSLFGTSYEGVQQYKPKLDEGLIYECSSSSPSVPYSTTDIVYNGETTRSSLGDDYTPNDLVYLDRDKHGRLRENENRRPSSRNNSRRSLSLEKVSVNGENGELQQIKTTAASSKQNHFRPTGIRQSYLRGEQFYSNSPAVKNNGSLQGVQKDDFVAMGTIWNQNLPAKSTALSLNNKPYTANSGTLPVRRGPPTSRFSMGTGASRTRVDVEPKYTDPAMGAPNSFQQRLIDLSALEAETVRWERSKKVKKKPKQDRDS